MDRRLPNRSIFRAWTAHAFRMRSTARPKSTTWRRSGSFADLPGASSLWRWSCRTQATSRARFVGATPVVVTRNDESSLSAWVNRCAHRGAMVCRAARGHARTHICAYHQWSYDTRGNLRGVPFRRGLKDSPGMPADFDVKDHGLQQLRVESYRGLVFATFSDRAPSLCDYIGPQMRPGLGRIFHKPIVYLDRTRQYSKSNWSATPSAGERAEGAVSVDQGRDLPADSGGWLRHCKRQRCLALGWPGAGADPQGRRAIRGAQ